MIEVLSIIRRHAREADDKARAACAKDGYRIRDYWLCVKRTMAQLHDDIARDMKRA